MAKIHRSIEIDAPVEQVFAYLTRPENLLEIWPSMVEISNTTSSPDGAHAFDWVYKMAGLRFHGHSRTTEVEKNRRVVVENTGIAGRFDYRYEAIGDRTRLTLDVDYSLPGKVVSRLAEPVLRRINENEADLFLRNLAARMERARPAARAQPEAAR